jgi:type I restriction enzyme S subunit
MEEWKSYKLGEISTIQTGPFGSQLHQSDYVMAGIPCIMPTNIGRMLDFQVEGIAFIKESDAKRLSRHIVREGDIIYSRRGDIEKCAYVSRDEDGWFCGTGCLKITINRQCAFPKFVAYYLSTSDIKSWIVGNAVGTTMLNLNTTVLSDVPIRLPSLQMQKEIVRVLDSLSDKITLNNRINHNLAA